MNREDVLAAKVQKLVEAFERETAAEVQRKIGVLRFCKGCGEEIYSKGCGRPRDWCKECRKPGGPLEVMTREYKRLWAAKMYALAKASKGGGK